jgi:hypothetical protein
MDVSAIAEALMPIMTKQLEALLAGDTGFEPDKDEMNAALTRLPDKPDEKLR